ncbi:COMPASS component SPP1 [Nymphon striatum]|nr:COMPASS component SPP1 [Nymphon striatum]
MFQRCQRQIRNDGCRALSTRRRIPKIQFSYQMCDHHLDLQVSPIILGLRLEKSGCVLKSHCDCKAGLGETCSHVAALLFKLEYATSERMSPADLEKVLPDVKSHILISQGVDSIECCSRGQSSSMVWHEQRVGCITASVAHQAFHTNSNRPAPSQVKKICSVSSSPLNHVHAVVWGQTHEEDAFQVYKHINLGTPLPRTCVKSPTMWLSRVEAHINCNVRKSDFKISVTKPFLGASPDGIIMCDCCGMGVLEINTLTLKKNHQYYCQLQLQMYVCNATYGDLAIWTTRDFFVTRIVKDDVFMTSFIQKLEELWTTSILPELLCRRSEMGIAGPTFTASESRQSAQDGCTTNTAPSISSTSKIVYCVCKSEYNGEKMVGCDNCDDWFYPSCLKMKRLPSTNKSWYCPPYCTQLIGVRNSQWQFVVNSSAKVNPLSAKIWSPGPVIYEPFSSFFSTDADDIFCKMGASPEQSDVLSLSNDIVWSTDKSSLPGDLLSKVAGMK